MLIKDIVYEIMSFLPREDLQNIQVVCEMFVQASRILKSRDESDPNEHMYSRILKRMFTLDSGKYREMVHLFDRNKSAIFLMTDVHGGLEMITYRQSGRVNACKLFRCTPRIVSDLEYGIYQKFMSDKLRYFLVNALRPAVRHGSTMIHYNNKTADDAQYVEWLVDEKTGINKCPFHVYVHEDNYGFLSYSGDKMIIEIGAWCFVLNNITKKIIYSSRH